MKLSILTPIKDAETCQAAGFDQLDIGINAEAKPGCGLTQDNWEEFVEEQAAYFKEKGIRAGHSHAYFSKDLYNAMSTEEFKREYVYLERTLHMAGRMGIPRIVVHPLCIKEFSDEETLRENVAFYGRLKEIAGMYGLKIDIENLLRPPFNDPDQVLRLMDMLGDDETFGMCLDTGHANYGGADIPAFIRRCGKRLRHTHVHDNHALNDAHAMPFWADIKWNDVMQALKDIGYEGAFNLELLNRRIPAPLLPSMLRYAHDTGRYLMELAKK